MRSKRNKRDGRTDKYVLAYYYSRVIYDNLGRLTEDKRESMWCSLLNDVAKPIQVGLLPEEFIFYDKKIGKKEEKEGKIEKGKKKKTLKGATSITL